MSDRHCGYIVVLERDLKDEDSAGVIQAIKMIKGVAEVTPIVANLTFRLAREQARHEFQQKLWKVLGED